MRQTLLTALFFSSLTAIGAAPALAGDGPVKAKGFAGDFLSSHFAQSEYDWKRATRYLDEVLEKDPGNYDLLRRSMILAMGAGDLALSAKRAQSLLEIESNNNLAMLIVAIDHLSRDEIEKAAVILKAMPEGDITDFIRPMLQGWIQVAEGGLNTEGFNITTIHCYSAGLMALYAGKKDVAADFAAQILAAEGVSSYDAERAGDLFAAAGDAERALEAYQGAYEDEASNWSLDHKILALKENRLDDLKKDLPPLRIKKPAHGAAVAMYDMARILFQEESDSSAKLFAHMTLALDPGFTDASLLLANNLARNGRYAEAIEYFSSIAPGHESWLAVQRHIADLLQEAGRTPEALALLEKLFAEKRDVESLIRIGDLYRSDEDYANALVAYNRAADHIGKEIPEKYWYLLYARGMTYEREGDWQKAEADLKTALEYRPDHPYLLNYLGYGWADQGLRLPESLAMIERAAQLRPDDGYITDSLGWVLYMMARYDDAVPHLEKAVELMPYDATLNDHLGDAYWQVGRKLEARFQWERAINTAGTDESMKQTLRDKLRGGPPAEIVKEASAVTAGPPLPAQTQPQ